jgi:hypothetical protein
VANPRTELVIEAVVAAGSGQSDCEQRVGKDRLLWLPDFVKNGIWPESESMVPKSDAVLRLLPNDGGRVSRYCR